MMKEIDFLTPYPDQIRHQIRNIIESYNHHWDVVAELAQNSVDAIRQLSPTKGHIKLEINSNKRTIVFEDNGCGIDPSELPDLMRPFSTNKLANGNLIGQKGVGISFVIFSSIHFEIETHHKNGSARASIEGARSWVESQTEALPQLGFSEIDSTGSYGTKVTVRLTPDDEGELFKLTFAQLAMILRTRTALGDTATIWGKKADKDLMLSFEDFNGNQHGAEFECSYLLPISELAKTQYISLRDFQDWNTGNKTDAQKRNKLRGKLVYLDGKMERGGRDLRYWACFVSKRKAWDIVSTNSGIIGGDDILTLNPTERMEKYGGAEFLFGGGMYTSTKGMPTGIRTEIIPKGSAGYLPNFFILIDDPLLSFDIGRKSIPGRQLGMLREVASEVFRNFLNEIKRYIVGEPDVDDDDWDRSAVFNEIREMPDLHCTNGATSFVKRPSNQEATIAAMFFEMIGNGTIENFTSFLSGYKNKYDLYAKYKMNDVVVEFKYALSSLFGDFDDEVKLSNEIDIVVVWEIVEKDHQVVKSRGGDLEKIEQGLVVEQDSLFHYRLVFATSKPVRVMCLKELVETGGDRRQ